MIGRPKILPIPLCDRASIHSVKALSFPFRFLHYFPAHRNLIPELAIQLDVIPSGKPDIFWNMIEQCPIERMKPA
jgi:hypothetical protein